MLTRCGIIRHSEGRKILRALVDNGKRMIGWNYDYKGAEEDLISIWKTA
jgi:hypothetical protein